MIGDIIIHPEKCVPALFFFLGLLVLLCDYIHYKGYNKGFKEGQDLCLDLEDPEELRMSIEERELELLHDKERLYKLKN